MSTDVQEAMQRVLALRQRSSVAEGEWQSASGQFLTAVGRTDSTAQLQAVLDQDVEELLLPPELKDAVYERLLALDGRSPATLREYAWHMQLYGPDRDEEAERLMAEAERSA